METTKGQDLRKQGVALKSRNYEREEVGNKKRFKCKNWKEIPNFCFAVIRDIFLKQEKLW